MQTPETLDIAHGIQLAVAPVFLLSAVGVTLTVLTNRLGRIIDRARLLEGPPCGTREEMPPEVHSELQSLSYRAGLIQRAITLSTACALCICLVIMTLFAAFALHRDLSWLIMLFFVAGLGAFIGALLLFLVEIRLATRTLRLGPGPH